MESKDTGVLMIYPGKLLSLPMISKKGVKTEILTEYFYN